MRPRVAIIGGGITGLAAANALSQRGPSVDVLLLEAGRRLGGVLETTRRNGFLIEAAADNFITSPSTAVDLCRGVGLEESLIEPDAARRQAFVVHNGRLQPIPAGFLVMAPSRMRPMLTTPLLSVRGKFRVALEYLLPRNISDQDESLAAFVRRRFGRELFDRLVQPLVGSIYAADPERLSVDAAMPRFREMERRHRSLIRAMLRQRRIQSSETGGARYGEFAALRDGMSSLVDALAERLPSRSVQLTSPVDRLVPLDGDRWLLLIGGEHPRQLKVDGVILATPAYRTAKILADVDAGLSNELAAINYASCAVVSLGYRRVQIGHPLNGFGFVVPLAEQRTIFSCSFSSVKYEGRARQDSVLLRVFIGGACQRGLLRLADDELTELAKLEVADLLQIRGQAVMHHVTRHHRAMAQYYVGHQDRVARINRRLARFPTLSLAGSAYGGVGIPSCIKSGEAACDQILPKLKTNMISSKVTCACLEASL